MLLVKRGQLVEFTDGYHQNYPPQDQSLIRYGVCTEDSDSIDSVPVMLADGSIAYAHYIHATAWAGWIPEGLEPILEQLEPGSEGWEDCDLYPGEEA